MPLQLFEKAKANLIKHSIMFLDQLTTLDGLCLLNWKAISKKTFINASFISITPKWFLKLEELVIDQNNVYRNILPTFIFQTPNLKGTILKFPSIITHHKEWIMIWNYTLNFPIIGCVIDKDAI